MWQVVVAGLALLGESGYFFHNQFPLLQQHWPHRDAIMITYLISCERMWGASRAEVNQGRGHENVRLGG